MEPRKKGTNKVLFIELNEFNHELLKSLSTRWGLKNIEKMLSFHETTTHTDDVYESDYLEPWVQWVSVHTGQPSTSHRIKHLGDVPGLHSEQIWEKLSKEGITSGIWGAMNASKATAENCLFFLPDPWTFSENAYPSELNPLLDALRYASKNYLNTSQVKLIQKIGRLLIFLGSKKVLNSFRKEVPNLLRHIKQFKGESFSYISLFDYLSTLLFLKMHQKYRPDFSLIFLNSLAHLQHHHWKKETLETSPRFKYGLTYLDRAFKEIFDHFDAQDTILFSNALSQKNTNEETPWILYRQKDQHSFLQKTGLTFVKVEPHMTHDAHIFFQNEQEREIAEEVLKGARVGSHPLFHVESYPEEPLKIFYKIIFTDQVPKETLLSINEKKFRFFDLFQAIVRRTGKHIQTATLLSNQDLFSKSIKNHEIFDCIDQCFQKKDSELEESTS